jgi:hypothetical protein
MKSRAKKKKQPVAEPMDAETEMDAEMGDEAGDGMDVGDLSIDVDNDGEFDEFDIYAKDGGQKQWVMKKCQKKSLPWVMKK